MENTFRGLDSSMNAAVLHVCDRLFPTGFDTAPACEAPQTAQELVDHIAATGRMLVSHDNCEGTSFGDREVNCAFRAWHDWVHWKHQTPFTLEGEIATAHLQIGYLSDLHLWTPFKAAYVLAEVEDQARYYDQHKAFPEDQWGSTYDGLTGRGFRVNDTGQRLFSLLEARHLPKASAR